MFLLHDNGYLQTTLFGRRQLFRVTGLLNITQ